MPGASTRVFRQRAAGLIPPARTVTYHAACWALWFLSECLGHRTHLARMGVVHGGQLRTLWTLSAHGYLQFDASWPLHSIPPMFTHGCSAHFICVQSSSQATYYSDLVSASRLISLFLLLSVKQNRMFLSITGNTQSRSECRARAGHGKTWREHSRRERRSLFDPAFLLPDPQPITCQASSSSDQYGMVVVKSKVRGSDIPGLESWFYSLPAVWPAAGDLGSLSFCFWSSKRGMRTVMLGFEKMHVQRSSYFKLSLAPSSGMFGFGSWLWVPLSHLISSFIRWTKAYWASQVLGPVLGTDDAPKGCKWSKQSPGPWSFHSKGWRQIKIWGTSKSIVCCVVIRLQRSQEE